MLCYHCGRIVRGKRGCPECQDMKVNVAEEMKKWGPWLRAEVRKRSNYGDGGTKSRRSSTVEEPEDGGSREEMREDNYGNSSFVGNPKWFTQ